MAINATALPVKYDRPLRDQSQRPGLTIWDVPGFGLYRVLHNNAGFFLVETLAPLGWIELIDFSAEKDAIETSTQALQVWLDIQSKDEPVQRQEDPAA